MLKSIAVMTSGGDSPGMNAAARAVVRTALYEGVKVWGIRDGYHGLLEENMFEMQSKDVGDIIQRGGTFLGTARCKRWKTPEGRMLGYQHLVDRGIQGLCVIGGDGSLTGLIIGPDEINAKYKKYNNELDSMVDTGNLERFSKQLTFMVKDALLTIRRLLNGIKTCYTEFKLSRAEDYAAQIDIAHIKKLLKAVQARIDFVNLTSTPTTMMDIISNKEIVEILYEFLKTKIEILDMSKLVDAMKDFVNQDDYKTMVDLVTKVQDEIKKNRNHNQIEMVKLDEVLQKLFAMLDISNLDDINEELRAILEEARRINEENERLSARYDGSYAFVKTYTDAIEVHPEYDKEDIAKVLDIVYEAVKDIRSANILVLQGRDNFVSSVSHKTVTKLIKAKLYGKLSLKDWYNDILTETYSNMKIF